MNILDKIKLLFSFNKKTEAVASVAVPQLSMREREEKIYDKKKLSSQKLYEQWSCKESWLLYQEGIPLLFGVEPGSNVALEDGLSDKIENLWEHAQECVKKKLLPVINAEKPEAEWQVRPIDLYSWGTISRITMPSEFSSLMTFVAQTIKPVETHSSIINSEDVRDMMYQKHREIVLGAATSLLVNATELCKNKKGRIVSNIIARNIIENEDQWFGNDEPLLAETAMADLIDEYLKLTRPLVY